MNEKKNGQKGEEGGGYGESKLDGAEGDDEDAGNYGDRGVADGLRRPHDDRLPRAKAVPAARVQEGLLEIPPFLIVLPETHLSVSVSLPPNSIRTEAKPRSEKSLHTWILPQRERQTQTQTQTQNEGRSKTHGVEKPNNSWAQKWNGGRDAESPVFGRMWL